MYKNGSNLLYIIVSSTMYGLYVWWIYPNTFIILSLLSNSVQNPLLTWVILFVTLFPKIILNVVVRHPFPAVGSVRWTPPSLRWKTMSHPLPHLFTLPTDLPQGKKHRSCSSPASTCCVSITAIYGMYNYMLWVTYFGKVENLKNDQVWVH